MFILFSKHFKIDSTQNIFTTLTFSILYMGRRVHGEHGVGIFENSTSNFIQSIDVLYIWQE